MGDENNELYTSQNQKKDFAEISKQAFDYDVKLMNKRYDFLMRHVEDQGYLGSILSLDSKQLLYNYVNYLKKEYIDKSNLDVKRSPENRAFFNGLEMTLAYLNKNCLLPLEKELKTEKDKPYNPQQPNENYQKALVSARNHLDTVQDNIQNLMQYSDSDSNKVRKMCSEIMGLVNYVNDMTLGGLAKPLPDEKYENGKKIHRINDYKLVEDKSSRDSFSDVKKTKPLMKKVYKNPKIAENTWWQRWRDKTNENNIIDAENKKIERENQRIDTDNENITDESLKKEKVKLLPRIKEISYAYYQVDDPLFDHDPCMEDIKQGGIGDCYFVGTLASIAARDPQYIRDAMTDNDDGTVTCRFYNDKQEPVYVTVEKSLPLRQVEYEDGSKKYFAKSAIGATWVSMMEKAYAKSGLKNELFKGKDYASLEGGQSKEAATAILGPHMHAFKNAEGYELKSGNDSILNSIINYSHKGHVITCSTKHVANHGDKEYELTKGIPNNHVYSLIKVTEDPNTHEALFHIRNPHAAGGRVYDQNRKAQFQEKMEEPGVSILTRDDFANTFGKVYVADFDGAARLKAANLKGEQFLNVYGDAVMRACSIIANNDNFSYKLLGKNSPKFNELRAKALVASTELKKKPHVDSKMDNAMKDLIKAAVGYKKECDEHPMAESEQIKEPHANRYFVADILSKMGEIRMANNNIEDYSQMKRVDFDELSNQVLYQDPVNTQAKRAMIDTVTQRNAPQCGLKSALSPTQNMLKFWRKSLYTDMQQSLKTNPTGDLGKFSVQMAQFLYVDKLFKSGNILNDKQLRELCKPDNIETGCKFFQNIPQKMLTDKKAKDIIVAIKENKPIDKVSASITKEIPRILASEHKVSAPNKNELQSNQNPQQKKEQSEPKINVGPH